MRKDKQAALKLRLSGKSYSEIQTILGVPKSTLSSWLSRVVISPELKASIDARAYPKSIAGLLRRNKNQTFLAQKRASEIQGRAGEEIIHLSSRDIFIFGIGLYWAEGYKRLRVVRGREVTHHPVSLTNADPILVKAFLKFLREICRVPEEKITANIRIYEHQNEETLKKFWIKQTGILPQNFRKTYYGISKSSLGKRPFNRLEYGVIQIVVADTKLFHRIIGYIEKVKKLL